MLGKVHLCQLWSTASHGAALRRPASLHFAGCIAPLPEELGPKVVALSWLTGLNTGEGSHSAPLNGGK